MGLAVFLFVTERLRVDIAALLIMTVLLWSGIITPAEGLAGFSNSATITIGAMFVLSAGLSRTGAVSFLGVFVSKVFQQGFWIGIIAVMLVVGVLSAFINNTPVIAIFLPIMLGVARDTGISASKLLMPISFASMFGGVCTLIGTSTNILVSSIAEKNGLRPFSMFELAPLGLLMLLAGTVYMLAIGIRLIPNRRGSGDLVENYSMNDYLTEIVLLPLSKSANQRIKDAVLVHDLDITILKIDRGHGEVIEMPSPTDMLRAGDVLLIRCDVDKIRALHEREGVEFKPRAKWVDESISSQDIRLVETIISPSSELVGSTLERSRFREKYRAIVLAIRHGEQLLREKLSDTQLAAGDLLLVEVPADQVGTLRRGGDLIITSEMETTEFRRGKAFFATLIVGLVVAGASLDIAPIVVTAVTGAIAMILVGCITIEEAYHAIEWKIIFLLAGVLSLGTALDRSGAAALVSANLLKYVGVLGPIALVSAFYLITSLLTETMSNNATAALMAPIAIATARTLEVDPMPFLFAITFAASASFMTPVGYQTNTMIYGPGQYKFLDFLKVGTPLSLLFWILASIFIPLFWAF